MKKEEEAQRVDNNQNEKSKEENYSKIDINEYKDLEGLTLRKMNIGLLYVRHRRHIRNLLIALLAASGIILCIYSIYNFYYYIAKGMAEDELLVRELVQTKIIGHDYILEISAKNLVYTLPSLLKIESNKYDIFSKISNPNSRYLCNIKYCFVSGNENNEIECSENFIFPNETKYLLSLAQTFEQSPENLRFIIKNIFWYRINLHKYPDWQNFYNEHLDIIISDAKFKPTELSGLSEKIDLNSLEFTVYNNTAYNYWDVTFNILLYSGNSIVGVNKYIMQEFMSKEKRNIQISWPGRFNRVSDIEIIPEINIMDEDVYIKYKGGVGEEK